MIASLSRKRVKIVIHHDGHLIIEFLFEIFHRLRFHIGFQLRQHDIRFGLWFISVIISSFSCGVHLIDDGLLQLFAEVVLLIELRVVEVIAVV